MVPSDVVRPDPNRRAGRAAEPAEKYPGPPSTPLCQCGTLDPVAKIHTHPTNYLFIGGPGGSAPRVSDIQKTIPLTVLSGLQKNREGSVLPPPDTVLGP